MTAGQFVRESRGARAGWCDQPSQWINDNGERWQGQVGVFTSARRLSLRLGREGAGFYHLLARVPVQAVSAITVAF